MQVFGNRAIGAITAVLLATGVATIPTTGSAQVQGPHARASQVTLKAGASRVDVGKPLVLTGKVSNRPRGTKVTLQKFRDGLGWSKERVLKVGKRGAVRYVDRPRHAGPRKYRLVVPRAGARPKATSAPVAVTVWRKIDLSDLAFLERSATFQRQVVRVGDAMLIEDGILADRAVDLGHMTWETLGTCTRLQASVDSLGIDPARARVTVDGAVVASGDFVDGGGRFDVSAAISGALQVGFEWDKEAGGSASPVMYWATVYCPF